MNFDDLYNNCLTEYKFNHNGKQYTVYVSSNDESQMEELIKKLRADEKQKEDKPKRKTGFERVPNGKYYTDNDGFAYADDNDPEFDDINYKTGHYYNSYPLAKAMSRANNLFSRMIRFAATHGGVGVPDGNGNHCFEIAYNTEDKNLLAITSFIEPGFTPTFSTEYDAAMAAEEFREDLLWYFREFLP